MDDDFPRVVALFDYVARSDQELTFRAGDVLKITDLLSEDWFDGEYQGHCGLIAAAYVRHEPNWRAMVANRSPMNSPQLTRKKMPGARASQRSPIASGNASSPSGHSPSRLSPRSSPKPARAAVMAVSPVSAVSAVGPGSQRVMHRAMPGMAQGDIGGVGMGVGLTDAELIQAKRLPRQPDRPDLAKALNIRNQAARVAGTPLTQGVQRETGPNALAMHLAQMKNKKAYANRGVTAGEAELAARLKLRQSDLEAQANKGEATELQQRMAALGRTRPN